MHTDTAAPATNLQAELEMAANAKEGAYIIFAHADQLARKHGVDVMEILEGVGMIGDEEPAWLTFEEPTH